MSGREDVLVVVDEDDKFKVLILIPLSLYNLLIFFWKERFLELGEWFFYFDMLNRMAWLIAMIDVPIYQRHVQFYYYSLTPKPQALK